MADQVIKIAQRRLEIETKISQTLMTLRETVQELSELEAERNMLLDEPEQAEKLDEFKKKHGCTVEYLMSTIDSTLALLKYNEESRKAFYKKYLNAGN